MKVLERPTISPQVPVRRVRVRRLRSVLLLAFLSIGIVSLAAGLLMRARTINQQPNPAPNNPVRIETANSINNTGRDNYELSRLRREASRRVTNSNKEATSRGDYYRSALRLLNRLNDVHTRL